MDGSKLIELVIQNECLYNKYSAGYKNVEMKNNIWSSIGQELGNTAELCFRRWTSLRDRYVRECKRADAPSGSAASNGRQWPFFEAMSFLKPHIAARPTRSSTNVLLDSSRCNYEGESSSCSSFLASTPLSSPNEDDTIMLPGENENASTSRGKKRRTNSDKDFNEAVQAFKNLCEARQKQLSTVDPAAEHFAQLLTTIISNMSEPQKLRAMKAAMDAVMSIKMEEGAECQ